MNNYDKTLPQEKNYSTRSYIIVERGMIPDL